MVMRGLNPAKYAQRRELAQDLPDDGTILHVYGGGQSALLKTVYKNRARQHIIVDRKIGPDCGCNGKVHTFKKGTADFMEKDLPLLKLDDLKLVDFDPYGSPGHDVQKFFSNYKVRRPLRISVTDGYALRLGLLKADRSQAEREVYSRYLTQDYGDGTRANQIRLLDNLMREMGRRHDLNVRRVNAAHGDQKTVYAGYAVSPA
jgi:hypothetical protein